MLWHRFFVLLIPSTHLYRLGRISGPGSTYLASVSTQLNAWGHQKWSRARDETTALYFFLARGRRGYLRQLSPVADTPFVGVSAGTLVFSVLMCSSTLTKQDSSVHRRRKRTLDVLSVVEASCVLETALRVNGPVAGWRTSMQG